MLPAGMALQSASKAPRQLGSLCSRSWSRACGGHSAVYTAAVEPQVIVDVQLIHSLLVCGLKTLICREFFGCPAWSGMHSVWQTNYAQSVNLMCQAGFSRHLSDICRLAMPHFCFLLTQPSCGVMSQTKHVGNKTFNLQQVSVTRQSVMKNSQQPAASSKALMIPKLHSAPNPQGSWCNLWLSLGPALYSPSSKMQMCCWQLPRK